MSIRRVQSSAIKPRTLGAATAITPWVRNPSWLALTAVGDSEQRFRGLVAVFPQGAYLALNATTSTGTYTVDWGDGSSENIASNTQANKFIDFNDADLAGTNAPVKLTDSGDLVERVDKNNNDIAHGYSNGMEVRFYNIVSTTGLTTAQVYYVINATANNFQVTTRVGDATQIVALTTNGTATLLPYKQAIVNVTPTTANLSTFNLSLKNTTTGLQAYETGWLDIEMGGPNLTASGLTIGGTNVRFTMCERAALRHIGSCTSFASLFSTFRALREVVITASTSAVTNINNMFLNCTGLQTVSLFNTAAVTNMSSMFSGCTSLTSVPLFNTAAVTNMSSMFSGCALLVFVPLFNTAAVTNMSSMFSGCNALPAVPLFNTIAVTNAGDMFLGCRSMASVPLFNTAAITSAASMFRACISLTSVPLFNTIAVTNMSSMFDGCTALTSVPLFNTTAVTSMSAMFNGCTSLRSVPLFNTAVVTNWNNIFSLCSSLTTIPSFNTSAMNEMASAFSNCTSLQSIPALVVTGCSDSARLSGAFTSCTSLSRIEAKDFRFTFSVANCRLGATELNEIYTNLPIVTGQTITVSNNVGTTGDDPTIATAKGWTVTG